MNKGGFTHYTRRRGNSSGQAHCNAIQLLVSRLDVVRRRAAVGRRLWFIGQELVDDCGDVVVVTGFDDLQDENGWMGPFKGATDRAARNFLIFHLGHLTPLPPREKGRSEGTARIALRPSGTEPKIKCYVEVVQQLAGRSLAGARTAAADRMRPLHAALDAVLSD